MAEHLRPGDAVLVMGAGKSYQIAQGLKAALEAGVLTPVTQPLRPMSGARSVFLGALLALGVAVLQAGRWCASSRPPEPRISRP